MRTIKNLPIPQDSDAKFPFSTIKNETETEEGTPVIREVYGDVLTNIYKLLQSVGITPSNTEDSDDSQYQILEALKKLPNVLNDVEQVLTLTGSVWSVPFNLTYLPSKYFFIARASSAYISGTSYTFKGTGATEYGFTSSGFGSSDEVLVIIDTAGVRAYSLSKLTEAANQIYTVMGLPVQYNDSTKLWYQENGNLISDVPSINDLESVIRTDLSNGTIIVKDIFISNGYALCFCLTPATNTYFFRRILLSNLTVSLAVNIISGIPFQTVSNYEPFVYMDNDYLYITNDMNSSANSYEINKFVYDLSAGTLDNVAGFSLDNTFIKTSNAVIKNNFLFTLINGEIAKFSLINGAKTVVGTYTGLLGNIFKFNGQIYFTAGQVAIKWTL